MADTNDRNQGSEHDLFDETAPRSIFAATWFRAVLVLIVLGVIGAVAVPYILDAMNAPKPSATAKPPTPVPPSKPAVPPPPVAVTPPSPPSAPPGSTAMTPTTPPTPPSATSTPSTPTPFATATPAPATPMDKPGDTKDALVAATTPPETPKPEPKATPEPKAKAEPRAKPEPKTAAAKPPAKTAKSAGGQWFVQVGAFKDPATAQKVAAKLRDDNYKVDDTPRGGSAATVAKATTAAPSPSSGSGDQYDVFITGQSPEEINQRLSAKGLVAEAAGNGVVVKPSLPLRDAVALSKDLAVDGLKVQVRRAGASTAAAPRSASAPTTSAAGDTLHRVSVGGFADRATAMATLKELEAKGYKPFLTRR